MTGRIFIKLIRHPPLHQKAATFAGEATYNKAVARHRLQPQAYIADVIAKIAGDWPASRWDELMPWNWKSLTSEPQAQAP